MPDSTSTFDPVAEQLLAEARVRKGRRFSAREGLTYGSLSVAFVAVAGCLVLVGRHYSMPSGWIVALLVGTYAIASRLEFEVGGTVAVATELIIIEMLFTLPPAQVPLWVALGGLLAQAPEYVLRLVPVERALVVVGSSWFVVGPALVFELLGRPEATMSSAHALMIVAIALAAQFALDVVTSTARELVALRVPPRQTFSGMPLVFAIDLVLAPIGLLAVIAARHGELALLLPLPLLGIIGISTRDRRQRMSQALELSSAYRGTAFLLGDVVESDDAYTGAHSRDVLDLVLAVADELKLDIRQRLNAEFAALLHDVGKIKVPSEIINKPGPLTAEERAIMNMHTIEGQHLLERVGGRLAEVGRIVRSCHEHWDGRGYPDGLAGEQIPLVARIVMCCDAFSAMTTDRPYRAALSHDDAVAELRRHRGLQFDPQIVDALLSVLESENAPERSLAPAGEAIPAVS